MEIKVHLLDLELSGRLIIFISMTRLEKCELFKSKGYTYNPQTGKIYGVYGKEINNTDKNGYINLKNNLLGHHFAWYMTYGNVDFVELDHEDRDPSNNRIDNLRISNRPQQNQNRNCRGYYRNNNKWRVVIVSNHIRKHIGLFDTEEEARQAYLQAKQKYHLITE